MTEAERQAQRDRIEELMDRLERRVGRLREKYPLPSDRPKLTLIEGGQDAEAKS